MSLKLNNGKINKKIRMVDTFDELLKQSAGSFPELDPTSITFFYVDEDNDKITVESDFDLQECKDYLKSVGGKSIKLFIEPKEKKAVVNSQFIQDNLDNNISYFSEKNGVFEIQNSINQSIVIDEAVKNKRIEEENKKLEEINGKYKEAKEKTEQFIKQISEGDIFASFKAEMVDMLSGLESSKKEEKPFQPAVSEPNQPLAFKKEPWFKSKEETIQEQLKNVCDKKWRAKPKQASVVHFGFSCNGCGINPIQGNRYKCSTCEDFDFCEMCKGKFASHSHPFVLYQKPVSSRKRKCGEFTRGAKPNANRMFPFGQSICQSPFGWNDPTAAKPMETGGLFASNPVFKYQAELNAVNRTVHIPQADQSKVRNLLIAFDGDVKEALASYMNGDEPAM